MNHNQDIEFLFDCGFIFRSLRQTQFIVSILQRRFCGTLKNLSKVLWENFPIFSNSYHILISPCHHRLISFHKLYASITTPPAVVYNCNAVLVELMTHSNTKAYPKGVVLLFRLSKKVTEYFCSGRFFSPDKF